ncbi:MAG TPA: hypothetical protein VFD01_12260, partial [Candidatus Dormibacteraeota bacterium]|nr:hypothetical protein [Candidatus Dormibacteraeota bacterium]
MAHPPAAAELRVARRARERREAEAWQALREGWVVEGLSAFRDQGRLRRYATQAELRSGMVEAWWQAGPERGLMEVDSSNQERDELNRLAQRRRLEAGELGPEALAPDDGCGSAHALRRGDRLLRRGDRALAVRVRPRPGRPDGHPQGRRAADRGG